jgi:hypothetical protein
MFRKFIKAYSNTCKMVGFQVKRTLTILKSFPVIDNNGKIGAVILKTCNDQKINEFQDPAPYLIRSRVELAKGVPASLHNQDLVWGKINSTVIDPDEWDNNQNIVCFWDGHLIVGMGRVSKYAFKPYADTIISKVPGTPPFQDPMHVIDKELITLQGRKNENALKYNSSEYFCFTLIDKTILTLGLFKQRAIDLKQKNKPYNRFSSACAQAGFEVLVGRGGSSKTSAQIAFQTGMLSIIKEGDDLFARRFRFAFLGSGLNVTANDLGREFLERQANAKLKRG